MKNARLHTKGFTLIASLLMLLLLSGIAIGLMMMVNTEGKVGGTDLQNNGAYHAAEGGIEKMASDLNSTFTNVAVPTPAQICAVGNALNQPVMTGVTWKAYSVQPGTQQGTVCPTTLNSSWATISGNGQNAGLQAQIIPVNMLATAALPGGQEVSMTRQAQVALIPAFQFGIFSDSDLTFQNGGTLDFAGPVHTNGDIYPFSAGTLTFHDKISAWGNVVRDVLPNGTPASSYNNPVYIPTADGNCAQGGGAVAGSCVQLSTVVAATPFGDGSVTGAGSATAQTGSTYIPNSGTDTWSPFSKTTANLELVNGNYGSTATNAAGTGAKKLSMSFVGGGAQPYEIIRRPPAGEDPNSSVAQSREYNMAQIRVLLSDDPNDLPGGSSDSQNIRLANITNAQAIYQTGSPSATGTNPWGITIAPGNYNAAFGTPTAGNNFTLYFAAASNVVPIPANCAGTTCPITSSEWPYGPKQWNTPATGNPSPSLQGLQPATGGTGFPGSPTFLYNGAPTSPLGMISLCPPLHVAAVPVGCPSPATAAYPYYAPPNNVGLTQYNSVQSNGWSLIDGYLRVEYKDASGNWNGVTSEWLSLGFARGTAEVTQSGNGNPATAINYTPAPNPINPNAILILQQPADRLVTAPSTLTLTTVPPDFAKNFPTGVNAPSACAAYNAAGTACATPAKAPVCSPAGANPCTTWTAGVPPLLVSDAGSGGEWPFAITPISPVASPLASATPQSLTQYNWYPINFYDAREGEVREQSWTLPPTSQPDYTTDNSCTTNGVMNAVEIDVGNLKRWLAGGIPGATSGTLVDYVAQNGYILYFSDRRGMLLNPTATSTQLANSKSGDSGLEDVINSSSQAGTPDGVLDPIPSGRTYSPEDVNENGVLDKFGAANLGLGFYGTIGSSSQNLNSLINTTPSQPDPFGTGGTGTAGYTSQRINSCAATGRKNWVSGARHVLKLVDGAYGNIPLRPSALVVTNPDGTTSDYWGGFTVASENPVYIQGDYNSNPTDESGWATPPTKPTDGALHAAASVIADAVTLLSNNWDDRRSMMGISGNTTPTYRQNRQATPNTYYRMGIASGKNMNFKSPSWVSNAPDVGLDGAMGNFMRLLEDWGQYNNNNTSDTLNYFGSVVSLFYSTYETGVFKCCWEIYTNGNRHYIFDTDFTVPQGLPPGTPMFHDVESLSYRQVFQTRSSTN